MNDPTPQVTHDDEEKRAALLDRCRAALDLMPTGSVFSHLTAAALHRLPLSYRMAEDERLHVMRPITSQRVRQPGIAGHRALHPRQTVTVDGLPVVGLADTWADLGEYQSVAFHSSPEQRAYDLWRREQFEKDDWIVEWIWNADLDGYAARVATVTRFANALEWPVSSLDLSACEPRFFSQYGIDLARQRVDRRLHRFSA